MDNLTPSLSPETSFATLQAAQNNLSNATGKLRALDPAAKDARQLQQIEAAAQDFEAVFMSEMLKPMFEGVEVDSRFGGGKGEEIFRGMMVQEYGKILAQTGGIGIADQVKAEMIKRQGLETAAIETTEQNASNAEFNTLIDNLTKPGDQ